MVRYARNHMLAGTVANLLYIFWWTSCIQIYSAAKFATQQWSNCSNLLPSKHMDYDMSVTWHQSKQRISIAYLPDEFVLFIFQSTRSSGTATWRHQSEVGAILYFNPRGPLGPRRGNVPSVLMDAWISIHAVLWDRDTQKRYRLDFVRYFNPRGPLGPRHNLFIIKPL